MLIRALVALAVLGTQAPAFAQSPREGQILINGRVASAQDLAALARYEQIWGAPVPPGSYWYDSKTGAIGRWGGPAAGFLAPGLGLGGGIAPSSASGGGSGRLSGVFINGRELHPIDVQGLSAFIGMPLSLGRFWVDAQGNFGPEGGPASGNLFWLAQASHPSSGNSYYTKDPNNHSSAFVGSGCAAVSGRLRASDESSSYDYYVGCE